MAVGMELVMWFPFPGSTAISIPEKGNFRRTLNNVSYLGSAYKYCPAPEEKSSFKELWHSMMPPTL